MIKHLKTQHNAESNDEDFAPQRVVLQAKQFRGSHTSQAITGVFDDMLQTWDILKRSVQIVLWDDAKNDQGYELCWTSKPVNEQEERLHLNVSTSL